MAKATGGKPSEHPTGKQSAHAAGPAASEFLTAILKMKPDPRNDNARFFTDATDGTKFLDLRISSIFVLAKTFMFMPTVEIEKLLDSNYYEVRLGAVSIMDFRARDKKTTAATKKELFELYINRHDCINNWDLVDRSAPYVVGGYLFDKDRAILYQLARSKNPWERRTAIVSTYFFIRQGDTEDTFKIANLLVHDHHELVQKAVGSWVREAGKKDPKKLIAFLDAFAPTMPRITLRYSIEKLEKKQKDFYMNIHK